MFATFRPVGLVVWAGCRVPYDGCLLQSDSTASCGIVEAKEQREPDELYGWEY